VKQKIESRYLQFLRPVKLRYQEGDAYECLAKDLVSVNQYIRVRNKDYKVINIFIYGTMQSRYAFPGEPCVVVIRRTHPYEKLQRDLFGRIPESLTFAEYVDNRRRVREQNEGNISTIYSKVFETLKTEVQKTLSMKGIPSETKIRLLKTIVAKHSNELRQILEKLIPNDDPQKRQKINQYLDSFQQFLSISQQQVLQSEENITRRTAEVITPAKTTATVR